MQLSFLPFIAARSRMPTRSTLPTRVILLAVSIVIFILLLLLFFTPSHRLPENVASLRERILTPREHQRAVASSHLKTVEKEIKEAHHLADTNNMHVVVDSNNQRESEDVPQISAKDTKLLEKAFHDSDSNADGSLTLDELASRIHENAVEHLDAAIVLAGKEFAEVDALGTKNDFVDWDELLKWELRRRKHNSQDLYKEDEEEMKELFQSADDNQDKKLSAREFMCYMHPELCDTTLDEFARDTMHGLDTNNDGRITLEEYIALPPGQLEGHEAHENEKKWQQQQTVEFRAIDQNNNNAIELDEFKVFLNPRNALHARNEANELIGLSDANADGKLSLEEMKKNAHMFLGSKVIDAGESFHQEF